MTLSLIQAAALLTGLVLLIQGARNGYRRGPLRQLAGLLALAIASLVGWLAGPAVGQALLADTAMPWLLRAGVGMLAIAMTTWLAALALRWRAGRRPAGAEEAENPVLGSLVGCWTGLLNASLLVLALCGWAGWHETLLHPQAARQHWAVEAHEDLAALPGAGGLSGWSPWPERWGRLVHKAQAVLGNPEASRRLMEQESVRALATHPSFYTAWGDPEIKALLRQGRFIEAAQHPKARPLMNDEAFQTELLQVNLEDAMDKALAKVRSPGNS